MRVRFENLGPIKKTEIDVRPLTVIIGPNNSGKTYVAYSIYGLWRDVFRSGPSSVLVDSPVVPWLFSEFEHACEFGQRAFLDELTQFFQDSSRAVVGKAKVALEVSRAEMEARIRTDLPQWLSTFQGASPKQVARVDKHGKLAPVGRRRRAQDEDWLDSVGMHLFIQTLYAAFPPPFLLPAERNALVITYKILANRRYRLLRRAVRDGSLVRRDRSLASRRQMELFREQGDVLYPEPIEHFLEFLEDVELEAAGQVERAFVQDAFLQLADLVEEGVQGGNHVFFDKTALGGRELRVRVSEGPTIDLSLASSSIKQIAPYLLYLRHRARTGSFLIIDEPEMNLHPDTQVRLLESLAILVNLGVHVLVTTHSPYFVDHLNNLIQGKTDDPTVLKKQAKSLYLRDTRAFLRPDQVGAYEMRDFKLVSLQRPEGDLQWDTLSDPFNQLQQKFFALYEAAHPSKARD